MESQSFFTNSTQIPQRGDIVGGYVLDRQLDCTFNSIVYRARNKNNEPVTIKLLKVRPTNTHLIENEISVMKECNSDYLIKMIEHFDYKPFKCIVMPLAEIGDLNQLLSKNGRPFSEDEAKTIMFSALKALEYLHSKGIWHRDIKINNFLVTGRNSDSPRFLLADFGYAKKFAPNEQPNDYPGTVQCAAPELIKNIPYDESVDIWSLGVFMYHILGGANPFPTFPECTMRRCIEKGAYFFPSTVWGKVSKDAKKLIDNMLQVDPHKRISISSALNSTWFQ